MSNCQQVAEASGKIREIEPNKKENWLKEASCLLSIIMLNPEAGKNITLENNEKRSTSAKVPYEAYIFYFLDITTCALSYGFISRIFIK